MTEAGSATNQGTVAWEQGITSVSSNGLSSLAAIKFLTELAHHKRILGAGLCTGLLIGVGYCLTLPTLYTATTKIMTPQQTQSSAALLMSQLSSSGTGSLAAAASSSLGLRNPNDLYIGLISSRQVADAIIQRFQLANEYRTIDSTALRKALAANTRIISEKSGFIAVSVTDGDKMRAAEIANSYTVELRTLVKDLALTEASQRRLFYEEQLKQAKNGLIEAELSFQQIQQKKGLVQLDTQAKAMITGLTELHAKVSAKEVELQALRSYSTEHNPMVQLEENELASLQSQMNQMEQRSHSSSPSEMGLLDVAGAGLEFLRAEHELQYRQIMFDLLLKQYDIARMDEAKDAAVIQVVEPAVVPSRRVSQNRTATVLMFGVLGFLAALFYRFACNVVEQHPEISQSLKEFRSALTSR